MPPSIAASRRKLIVVAHTLTHAVVALRAARAAHAEIEIWSAAGASAYLGAGYFAALERVARARVPRVRARFVLDCGDRAGDAMAALRAGIEDICFTGPPETRRKLSDIARRLGASVTGRRAKALDLLDRADAAAACRAALGGDRKTRAPRSVAKRRVVV